MTVNGERRDLAPMTVAELLEVLAVNPRGVAVAVDGEVVTRSTWNTVTINNDAVVEILTAAAGG